MLTHDTPTWRAYVTPARIGDSVDTQLLTLNEVKDRLRVGKTTLKRLINEDEDFVTIKMGHRRLMRVEALEKFLKAKEGAA